MQLELKPANKLTYKLRLTPQIKLAINLLQMPLVKLQEYVKQQLEENPLLEVDPVRNTKSLEGENKISNGVENIREFTKSKENIKEEIRREYESGLNCDSDEEEKQNYRESLITTSITLYEHLLRQLHLLTDVEDERKIGELIIGNIDDNGYFKSSIEELAESVKATPFKVEKVLNLIQTFEPIGVGARNLRESLLLQIKAKGQESSLAGQIIDRYLAYLEKKRFNFIAKKLKVDVKRVKEALKEIANLEPKPGRSFNTERAVRLIPDAILKKDKDKYEVILNDWQLPRLNLNPKYQQMIKQKDISKDTKEYLRKKFESAHLLINAINKRKQTLQKVTEAIVYLQKDFLNNGMLNLKPMTLSQIANLVGKHKSTVSRAVANKYLQTPDGIFELRQFLNSGVKQETGEIFSSKAIRAKIKELIQNENKEKPLTDQKIAELLKQEGISISRRTIAKYRNQLKVLPFQSRQE